jgi:hypothetical protein
MGWVNQVIQEKIERISQQIAEKTGLVIAPKGASHRKKRWSDHCFLLLQLSIDHCR